MYSYDEVEDVTSGRDKRRNRLLFVVVSGSCLLGLFFLLHLFPITVLRMTFFGYAVTVLSYGDSFYVRRKDNLGERWLWKSVIATIPLHLLFLGGVELLVRSLPNFARTGFASVAFIALCFAIESVLFDSIAERFESLGMTPQAPSDKTPCCIALPINR